MLEAALIGPERVADALGGVGPQGRHAVELAADALHRALAAAAGSGLRARGPPAERESGSWSRSAAASTPPSRRCSERERGAEVVAVTLKLWADRHTDAEQSCCSPAAVLGARGARAPARASRT